MARLFYHRKWNLLNTYPTHEWLLTDWDWGPASVHYSNCNFSCNWLLLSVPDWNGMKRSVSIILDATSRPGLVSNYFDTNPAAKLVSLISTITWKTSPKLLLKSVKCQPLTSNLVPELEHEYRAWLMHGWMHGGVVGNTSFLVLCHAKNWNKCEPEGKSDWRGRNFPVPQLVETESAKHTIDRFEKTCVIVQYDCL